jgi:1-acyl-sn-glycerol-3-phosphate acyltransferase
MDKSDRTTSRPRFQAALDFGITVLLWTYFLAGFVFLPPFYIAARLFPACGERTIQRFNSRFYRGFFALVRALMPGHRWQVDPEVKAIRSSVLVCNHVSYLDSILMIALFDRHTTLVKSRLFDIPVFGTMLRWSGYIPAAAEGRLAGLMVDRVERARDFLAGGGNLFVFPEGTRSRDGQVGRFNPGAFKIARHCRAPIRVVSIRNTDRMFRPDSFAFDTRGPNMIRVQLVGAIDPGVLADAPLSRVLEAARSMLVSAAGQPAPETTPNRETPAGGETQP